MKRIPQFTWAAPTASTLEGQNVAVIGGTGGIGRALAQALARKGASVLAVGRNFRDEGVPNLHFMAADLSLMSEAARVAEALPAETLDMVIFTTGVMAGPRREVTAEGIEQDLAISYLSRFVILNAIAERLGQNRTAKPRVFVMGFPGTGQKAVLGDLNSEQSYARMRAHSATVAGNEALA